MTGSMAQQLADAVGGLVERKGSSTPTIRRADWQTAVVTAVNSDGTVDIGDVRARRLEQYQNPTVGDLIMVTQSGNGNWIAAGRTASTAGTAWTSYTPTWTSSGTAPSLGNGTLVGRYQRSGRTIVCHINLTIGSTTTVGTGNYSFALPFQAASAGCSYVGTAHFLGADRWAGENVVSPGATTTSPFFPDGATSAHIDFMTNARPEAVGNGDQMRMTFTYEAAS